MKKLKVCCDQCKKQFNSDKELLLYFCSKRCETKFDNRDILMNKLNKELLKKHKKLLKNFSLEENFGYSIATSLFIYRKKLDNVFNKYCHSDEYIRDLKKEAKLFGKFKNDD